MAPYNHIPVDPLTTSLCTESYRNKVMNDTLSYDLMTDDTPPPPPLSPFTFPSPPLCCPGDVAGGYPVFLLGNNFVNTSALGCRFADLRTRGIFVSNHTILCLAPSTIGQSSPPDPPHLHIFST